MALNLIKNARGFKPLSRLATPKTFRTFSSGDPFGCPDTAYNNIPPNIAAKIGKNLHKQPNHPINIIKRHIDHYFSSLHLAQQAEMKECKRLEQIAEDCEEEKEISQDKDPKYEDIPFHTPPFKIFDSFHPRVPTKRNFDDLLIPSDHPSRRPTDTYYFDKLHCLRTHTSAHQSELLGQKERAFLVTADCYRRDEIDARHYPVFHQMEGVRVFTPEEYLSLTRRPHGHVETEIFHNFVMDDLKATLEGLARHLFGEKVEMRWVDAYFPFTDPSIELEILFQGNWMEVLGCGVVHRQILRNAGMELEAGWAFGLGLERLAMALFDIPDIRLFWSEDPRFHKQFESGQVGIKFQPYSKYPACYKDISFWIPKETPFNENNFFEMIRTHAGDLVENVQKVDEFKHPKTGETSLCFRILYRSMDRNLTNEEIDAIQFAIRKDVPESLGVRLR